MRRSSFLITALMICAGVTAAAAPRRRAIAHPPLQPAFCDNGEDVAGVSVPSGFCIRKFADVPTPRVLAFAPNGDLFVSSPRRVTPGGAPRGTGAIYLFPEARGERVAFATGDAFETVHALLVTEDKLYYSTETAVLSVPWRPGDRQIAGAAPVTIADVSLGEGGRWTHSLAREPDGTLLVSNGQADNNNCPLPDARIGAVMRIGPGHPARGSISVDGMRDPLYIRCMPWDRCYAMELSGDVWENLGGKEKLVELHDGDTYGYPCCIDRGLPNPDINPVPDCSRTATTLHTFPLHDTPFGFDWERGFGWPEPYRNAFFLGLHGKFGSWLNAGLQWAPTDPETHLPSAPAADFATGFGRFGAIARVADVLFAPDGRLFFTDDQGGAIYWIAPRTLRKPR
jgi:glucose/arabinose dehydrogenase